MQKNWHRYKAIEKTEQRFSFYNGRRKNLLTMEQNHAHKVLAEWEKEYNVIVITQNVDDLS